MKNSLTWRKSSYSGQGGTCVEVAAGDDGQVLVRDSKNPNGPVLTFSKREWAAWLAGCAAGEFNDLA